MAYLKAREVRDRCKGRVDPEVIHCLEALAEQQSVFRQQLLEVGGQLDQMTNIMSHIVTVAGNMKGFLERLKVMNPDDEGPATYGG